MILLYFCSPDSWGASFFLFEYAIEIGTGGEATFGWNVAEEQMKAKQYAEPFKADKRKVIALAIELDDMGKGLVDWKEV